MKTNQPELPLMHFPFQEYLGGFNRVRKAIGPKIEAMCWLQLPLKMILKKLFKASKSKKWTLKDRMKFLCVAVENFIAVQSDLILKGRF